MREKILAAIVAHPFRKVCGATNAGVALSLASARLTELELAMMWDGDESLVQESLPIHRVRCTTPAGRLSRFLPRPFRIAFADSVIPRMISERAYDLVHIHNLFPLFAAERIADACVRSKTPFVISTHGLFELSQYSAIRRFGAFKSAAARLLVDAPFRRILSKADCLFCLSPADVDLVARLGFPSKPTHIVTNGVNEYFLTEPSLDDLQRVRAKFQLAMDVPTLLFMGSLHSYKGVDVYLESLNHIERPFQAVVAGRFSRPNEPTELIDRAKLRPDLRPHVRFTGAITDADLRALYRLADVFVYPTRGDTLPLVILEAMASGLPIVSTTVGGIPYEVPPECGVLTAAGDPAATGRAVNELLADEPRMRRLGAAARHRVETVFRWSLAARSAMEGYEKVLKGRRVPAEFRIPVAVNAGFERSDS